jgi:hypothetical protein
MLNKQEITDSLSNMGQPKPEGTLRTIGHFALNITSNMADRLNFHPVLRTRETVDQIGLLFSADYNAPQTPSDTEK